MDNRNKLTVVIGVKPLPGTLYGRDVEMKDVLASVRKEAGTLYDAGVRSIMIQNVNDLPAYDRVGIDTVAMMTAVACELKRSVGDDCLTGISILRNDTPACMAVAKAAELDYVRAKVYVGTMVRTVVEPGGADDTLAMKAKLNCRAEIWADVHDRMGVPLGNVPLKEACNHALKAKADKLILTGKNFDETIKMVSEIKEAQPKASILIGGGVNAGNVEKALRYADGIIIASSLKRNGDINEELDPDRLKGFMDTYRNCCGE